MDGNINKSDFSRKLRNAREKENYTQEKLAELIGVKNTSISDYENDISTKLPTLRHLYALASVLNISVDWLLDFPSNSKGIATMLSFLKAYKPELDIEEENGLEYAVLKLKGVNSEYSQVEIAKFIKAYIRINEINTLGVASEKMKDELETSLYNEYKHLPGLPEYRPDKKNNK